MNTRGDTCNVNEMYKKPLGDILQCAGIITEEQLETALIEQKRTHKRLGEVLIDLSLVTEEQITEVRAAQLDVGYVNLKDFEFDPAIVRLIPESIARNYDLIPVKFANDKLIVAMSDPLDVETVDLVQFETKNRIEPALATEWRIEEAINRQYGSGDDLHDFVEQASLNVDTTIQSAEELDEGISEIRRQGHRAPVVRMVNLFLTQAVRKKASDIHIEPRLNTTDVRYRVDGNLRLVKSVPKALHPAMSSRVKIMAELDIAERRLPQDGRISARIDGRSIDVRVSTSPTLYGERIVMRILDRSQGLLTLDQLGFTENDLKIFNKIVAQPYGIILVTGPTGSGKTTTLYAALAMLRNETNNIMTVEDPVEYELEGINQTNVNNKIGLNFARQLRSILRQDPDIILVGEIRDSETADVAFRSALTGHLVLSTLHCNDAPGAITRLIEMDVEPFLVSSAIIAALAQRLVRVLCNNCKEQYDADDGEKEILGVRTNTPLKLYKAVGCGECDGLGYRGRTAIREIMVMNDEIRDLALKKSPSTLIKEAAVKSGMKTMRQDGIAKVLDGTTTFEEFHRKVFIETEMFQSSSEEKAA